MRYATKNANAILPVLHFGFTKDLTNASLSKAESDLVLEFETLPVVKQFGNWQTEFSISKFQDRVLIKPVSFFLLNYSLPTVCDVQQKKLDVILLLSRGVG